MPLQLDSGPPRTCVDHVLGFFSPLAAPGACTRTLVHAQCGEPDPMTSHVPSGGVCYVGWVGEHIIRLQPAYRYSGCLLQGGTLCLSYPQESSYTSTCPSLPPMLLYTIYQDGMFITSFHPHLPFHISICRSSLMAQQSC